MGRDLLTPVATSVRMTVVRSDAADGHSTEPAPALHMTRRVRLRCTLLALCVFATTRPDALPAQQRANDSVVHPSVTLPAALDRVLRDYERAWRAADPKALAELFTEDGFVLQPGRPPARGRASLVATYTGQGGGDLRLRALAFAHADSVGYIIGAYRYGSVAVDMGKFTLTLRRSSEGSWLIASDMDSENASAR